MAAHHEQQQKVMIAPSGASIPSIALAQCPERNRAGSDTSGTDVAASLPNPALEAVYTKISRRIVPLFLVVMVLNHVDRTNLAFAAPTLLPDLGFGPAIYGLGSGLFFLPFCFFQVPSNLIVVRVGVRRWLSVLLFGWGCVASCLVFMHDVASFYVLRVMLGVFESGAVPAMWFHLTQFYTPERQTKPYAFLTIGVLVAQAVGGPVAALFLMMDGLGGLKGWQWLFLLEGLPTVLLAGVVLACLPDSPDTARWLTAEEKALLADDLRESRVHSPPPAHIPRSPVRLLRMVFSNPLVPFICFLGFLLASAAHTYVFFLPIIIQSLVAGGRGGAYAAAKPKPPGAGGHGPASLKLMPIILTCIPYTLAAVTSFCVAHSSQRRRELFFHTALPAIIGGLFFVLFPFMARASMQAGFAALVLVAISGASAIGPKMAIVSRIAAGPSQVMGVAVYNSISVLGGFVGPFITGRIVERTGSFAGMSIIFGAMLIVCGSLIIALKYLVALRERRLGGAGVPCTPGDEEHGGGTDGLAPAALRKFSGAAVAHPDAVLGKDVGADLRPRGGAAAAGGAAGAQ